jgi:lysophospholipase L1-like esterase
MKFKYIFSAAILIGLFSCDDADSPIPEDVVLPELSSGSADFSNYVALGASFAAGFSDGSLFLASQQNSFPNLLAQEFSKLGGNSFRQPLLNDNVGGLLIGGVPNPSTTSRLIFNGSGAERLNATTTTEALEVIPGPFQNLGIPGAKSFNLVSEDYGNPASLSLGLANPYYVRAASSPSATLLGDALSQNPTFFTLSLIGGNDYLGFATSGGDGSNPLTPLEGPVGVGFNATYNALISGLTANGAKGVITLLPAIEDVPFFTTVPNNALVLDAATAAQLTGVFQAVSGIFSQGLQLQGVPATQANALATQYAITFNEGANRWIIDTPISPSNPLGFRQMTEEELLLLTIDQAALANGYGTVLLTPEVLQVLGLLQQGGTPTQEEANLVLAAVNGIDDQDVLDATELLEIQTAIQGYNSTIQSIADANDDLALVDLNQTLRDLRTGINFDGFTLTSSLVTGGAFSLDGIHLNARGYALMANQFLEAIDSTFGSNFLASGNRPFANNFGTNYSPNL